MQYLYVLFIQVLILVTDILVWTIPRGIIHEYGEGIVIVIIDCVMD